MKGGKRHQGYTIVEVMIVLAVSGVMFIIAANFVSGKQARTAFTQGTASLASDIQGAIEAVVDGQYTDVPLSCSVVSGAPRKLSFASAGTDKQGANQDCTFLGELFHFSGSTPLKTYDIVYLAGAKTNATGGPLTSLANSAISPITTANGTINLTKTQAVPQSLEVSAMQVTYTNGVVQTDTSHFNFGVIQGQGTLNSADPSLYDSGAQTVGLVVDPTLGTSHDAADVAENTIKTANSVIICLTDGTRKSQITIGDNGNQLKATAIFHNLAAIC
jgi:prepilin-type N-terminal cleavage/methylation domain-containing protein